MAFTVGELGESKGVLQRVTQESADGTVVLTGVSGRIAPKLALARTPVRPTKLLANSALAHQGVIPLGEGFRLTATEASTLGYPDGPEAEVIKPYKIGRDLVGRDQGLFIIDLYGHTWPAASRTFKRVSQIVLDRVKPQRDQNRRPKRRKNFWLYADSCEDMRQALTGQKQYIATCRTAKHRIFSFLDGKVLPDAKIVAITISNPETLAILSSRLHIIFAIEKGGRQGVGNDPVYQHSDTFGQFAFPALTSEMRSTLQLLGDRLDAFRKERLAEHSWLTMTDIYNALERAREVENGCDVPPFTDSERDAHDAGLISLLKGIHDDIDRAVFAAYGWEDLLPELLGKPGATVPSEHKAPEQERAEDEVVSRLDALNQERSLEERRGLVRWLRPEYQLSKLHAKVRKPEGEHVGELDVVVSDKPARPEWPNDGLEQIRLVRDLLASAPSPTLPEAIASVFDGKNTAKRRHRVAEVLDTLVATGLARTDAHGDQLRYFLPR